MSGLAGDEPGGAFIAIAGPSGAGKDAVIEVARTRFADHGRVHFPQRVITRPAGSGEDHLPVSAEEFAVRQRSGGFALSWRAHGFSYGIPEEAAQRVAAGRVVVVNVSRAVLGELPQRFGRARIVRVTVPEAIRRERIMARGREDDGAGSGRSISRSSTSAPSRRRAPS